MDQNGMTKEHEGGLTELLKIEFKHVEKLFQLTNGLDTALVRRILGMTQEQFAHAIGVTHSTVARWENKQARMPLELLLRVGRLLETAGEKDEREKKERPRRRAANSRMKHEQAAL
jgi:DNA-binding transcriptional regulator YiaG